MLTQITIILIASTIVVSIAILAGVLGYMYGRALQARHNHTKIDEILNRDLELICGLKTSVMEIKNQVNQDKFNVIQTQCKDCSKYETIVTMLKQSK